MLILILYNVKLFVLLVILSSLTGYLFKRFKAGVINLFMLAFTLIVLAETVEVIYEQVYYLEGVRQLIPQQHDHTSILAWTSNYILHIISYSIIGYLVVIKDFGVYLTKTKEDE